VIAATPSGLWHAFIVRVIATWPRAARDELARALWLQPAAEMRAYAYAIGVSDPDRVQLEAP
jgi:hypothetical protein